MQALIAERDSLQDQCNAAHILVERIERWMLDPSALTFHLRKILDDYKSTQLRKQTQPTANRQVGGKVRADNPSVAGSNPAALNQFHTET